MKKEHSIRWREEGFPYNPAHPIGTCAKCGEEMTYNVPRIGPDGGYVHKETGYFTCGNRQDGMMAIMKTKLMITLTEN